MTKYPLTPRQKNLLQEIAPGLRDESIAAMWEIGVMMGDTAINKIFLWFGNEEKPDVWANVAVGDFYAFEESKLLRITNTDKNGYPSKIVLNTQLILNAVDTNFDEDPWIARDRPVQQIAINANQSIVNVNSTLNHVTQTIDTSSTLPDEAKDELHELVQQLQKELSKISESMTDEAQALAELTDQLVAEASTPKPNRFKIQITREGMIKAAETVSQIGTRVLPLAVQIADIIQRHSG
jgi:hypothetical protein